jgi:SART-1 family
MVAFLVSAVLDEEEDDTLINVNIIDDERAAKNVENKKKKPTYQPYDQDEFDEQGMVCKCFKTLQNVFVLFALYYDCF